MNKEEHKPETGAQAHVDEKPSRTFAEAVPHRKQEPSEVIGKKETILLVEDEQMLLELLKSVLEEDGYHIVTAADGEEAVEIFRSNKNEIGLVLADMGLPKLGGWEMFEKLREMKPNVKVILASGFVDPKMRTELMNRGAKDFVQKPYVPTVILKRIREVLDSD